MSCGLTCFNRELKCLLHNQILQMLDDKHQAVMNFRQASSRRTHPILIAPVNILVAVARQNISRLFIPAAGSVAIQQLGETRQGFEQNQGGSVLLFSSRIIDPVTKAPEVGKMVKTKKKSLHHFGNIQHLDVTRS